MAVSGAGASTLSSVMQLIGVLLIFVFVLAAVYVTTKWIAGYQKGQMSNKNLRVVETLKITPNKYIQIIEAGEEYLVIAIGKDEIQFLTKLTKEQLKEIPEEDGQVMLPTESFKEILDKLKEHLPKKQADENE